MKRTILLLIAMCWTVGLAAQDFPIVDGKITYQKVIEAPGKSVAELVALSKSWYLLTFPGVKSVDVVADKEAGIFSATGSLRFANVSALGREMPPNAEILFDLKIEAKTDKLRYTFTNFRHRWLGDEIANDGGPLEAEKPAGNAMFRMQKRVWHNFKQYTFDAMQIDTKSLEDYMKEGSKKGDDW